MDAPPDPSPATVEPRAVAAGATTAFLTIGAGLLLALAGRAALDWTKPATTFVATLFAIAGFVLGGFRAGLGCPPAPLTNGAAAAVAAYLPVGIVQRVVAGKGLNPLGLLLAALFAACFGVFGGYVSNNANRARGRL